MPPIKHSSSCQSSISSAPQILTRTSFVIFCGLGSGGFFSLQSSIVAQLIGSHRVSIGVGWLEVAMSFGNLAGPISAGALLDAFGGPSQGPGPYKPAIVSFFQRSGRSLIISTLLALRLLLLHCWSLLSGSVRVGVSGERCEVGREPRRL
jgi:MFS family permease